MTGPAGCGKTSIARILAAHFKVSPENITEADAATNTGIDAMREITSTLRYQGFGETPNKMIILDDIDAHERLLDQRAKFALALLQDGRLLPHFPAQHQHPKSRCSDGDRHSAYHHAGVFNRPP